MDFRWERYPRLTYQNKRPTAPEPSTFGAGANIISPAPSRSGDNVVQRELNTFKERMDVMETKYKAKVVQPVRI